MPNPQVRAWYYAKLVEDGFKTDPLEGQGLTPAELSRLRCNAFRKHHGFLPLPEPTPPLPPAFSRSQVCGVAVLSALASVGLSALLAARTQSKR